MEEWHEKRKILEMLQTIQEGCFCDFGGRSTYARRHKYRQFKYKFSQQPALLVSYDMRVLVLKSSFVLVEWIKLLAELTVSGKVVSEAEAATEINQFLSSTMAECVGYNS